MAKKLLQMKSKLASGKPKEEAKEKTSRELLVEKLVDRGTEVLEAAENMFPKETAIVVNKIGELIKKGAVKGYISGGELLQVFRSLGLRVRVPTTITIAKDGETMTLAQKLKYRSQD